MLVLLYSWSTWTLRKFSRKSWMRTTRTVLKKSWEQYPRKQKLYGSLPPISQTIQEKRVRYDVKCRRTKDEHINLSYRLLKWIECTFISIYLSVYLSIYLSVRLSVCLSKFLWWCLISFITKNIQSNDLICIVILTTIRVICPSAFIGCYTLLTREPI